MASRVEQPAKLLNHKDEEVRKKAHRKQADVNDIKNDPTHFIGIYYPYDPKAKNNCTLQDIYDDLDAAIAEVQLLDIEPPVEKYFNYRPMDNEINWPPAP